MARVDHITAPGNSTRPEGSPGAAPARIVVLDGATANPGDNPWDGVAALGALEVHERTPPPLVVERARGARIVLTNKTVLDAAALESLAGLELVCVLATGVNVVDLAAARRLGITVCNVPGYSQESVAQHVLALLLEVTNAVGEHSAAVHSGEWSRAADFSFWKRPLVELAGATMGIVGHGGIGARVGRIAHALGMKVLAFSPSRSVAAGYEDFEWATVAEIFESSDVVSLHCPLTRDNLRFVSDALLATMREGSILVNTARGDLIDEAALVRALDRGRPAAAALDVLSIEPPPPDHPLASHPRCVVTPHVAWATLAARRRLIGITAGNIRAFLEGRPKNVVAAPQRAAASKGERP